MPDNNMASKELPFSIHIIGNAIGVTAHILGRASDWQLVTQRKFAAQLSEFSEYVNRRAFSV